MLLQVLELLGSSNRRLVEAAAVMMSHAGSAMRPRLAEKAQLLTLASNRLVALARSDSLRGAKASVRQAHAAHTLLKICHSDAVFEIAHALYNVSTT